MPDVGRSSASKTDSRRARYRSSKSPGSCTEKSWLSEASIAAKVRPRKRQVASSTFSSSPRCDSSSTSTVALMISLSTSTPSQSKITS